jgi:predicted SAM-dependent methyltransferase
MERKYGLKVETIMQIKRLAATLNYKLYLKWKSLLQTKRIIKNNTEIRLEIGSGPKKGTNGWVTVDTTRNCDLRWDLRDGIPFPDNSVSMIYSSHVFEHIPYQGIIALMKECHRVLKKGGVFSICVPNARPYILDYAENRDSFWNALPAFYEPALTHNSPIDKINYIAYMDGEHKYLFDEKNLVSIIASVGFKDVKMRNFDDQIDIKERDFESIYAIATADK